MDTKSLPGDGGLPLSSYSFEVDPCAVLGITNSATLNEIRDAYRLKVKKHHPDHGGDDWVFRIVTKCYEIVSATRVIGHASRDTKPSPAQRPPSSPSGPKDSNRDQEEVEEWLRPGQRDRDIDPALIVDVEIFVARYELTDPMEIFRLAPEQRRLCSCLNVSWKTLDRASRGPERPDLSSVLSCLTRSFDEIASRTNALSSWSRAGENQFEGWLSYPTVILAWEAFGAFRETLHGCGLGVNQWTREMTIPRGSNN